MSEGHAPMTGDSLIVTVNEHELLFPSGSLAVHATVVVPKAKVLPLAGEHVTVAEQLSVALGFVQDAIKFPHCAIGEGHEPITGLSLSVTVTVKEQVALPLAFEAVTVTVVVPTGKLVPEF